MWWPIGKVSVSELEETQFYRKFTVYESLVPVIYDVVGKTSSRCVGVVRKFEEGVQAQLSSSSSGRGSKLRAPSQNRLFKTGR
uniref:Uncharacterized protein n=1 Tax=Araneus ventricosus TaxID=182803 RepID=A0A4Y2C604_ARAVE|nr:hypothetical protein AVEN_240270-1 [Araneus ventricosus]